LRKTRNVSRDPSRLVSSTAEHQPDIEQAIQIRSGCELTSVIAGARRELYPPHHVAERMPHGCQNVPPREFAGFRNSGQSESGELNREDLRGSGDDFTRSELGHAVIPP
jgi:hypothetical protein